MKRIFESASKTTLILLVVNLSILSQIAIWKDKEIFFAVLAIFSNVISGVVGFYFGSKNKPVEDDVNTPFSNKKEQLTDALGFEVERKEEDEE